VTPKDAQQLADDDLRVVMGLEAGRRFVWRLLTQAGLYSSSYVESATATAYNEGRRAVALALLAEAQRVAPELYTKALREELEAQDRAARERQLEQEQADAEEDEADE
jgi:hypothetical protein